jgi:hypothetical protein
MTARGIVCGRSGWTLAAGVVGLAFLGWAPSARGQGTGDRPAAVSSTHVPYHGLAAWIDIFDAGPWARPGATVRRLAGRGVGTVFLQTSNYRRPHAIHRPSRTARLLAAARRHGVKVIAWYLPGFADLRRDWLRVKAAVTYASPAGDRFDGFAMDIEATAVADIATRNRRMLRLSSRLRRLTGDGYGLGAIIPDPVSQRYWPRFPYRAVRARYDAILPMSYWTFQRRGAAAVYRYTRRAVRLIRARTADAATPVHLIGGIASHASAAEVGAFTRAAIDAGAAGASLYDASITSEGQWARLGALRRLRAVETP